MLFCLRFLLDQCARIEGSIVFALYYFIVTKWKQSGNEAETKWK
jgi:hypothetical protein